MFQKAQPYDFLDNNDLKNQLNNKCKKTYQFKTQCKDDVIISDIYKKLSYRRETARQLPTWREGGVRPSSPLPLRFLWLHLCVYGCTRKPQCTYVKRDVRKAHFKINRAFKVIQGHPYWCRQESRMVFCRNVQLMMTLFLKLTKIRQRENGKFVDFNDLTQV